MRKINWRNTVELMNVDEGQNSMYSLIVCKSCHKISIKNSFPLQIISPRKNDIITAHVFRILNNMVKRILVFFIADSLPNEQ